MSETRLPIDDAFARVLDGPPQSPEQVAWTAEHNALNIKPIHPGGLSDIYGIGGAPVSNARRAGHKLGATPPTLSQQVQSENVDQPTAANYNLTLAAQYQAAAKAETLGYSDAIYFAHQAALAALKGFSGRKNWGEERLSKAVVHLDERFFAMLEGAEASRARSQATFDQKLTAPRTRPPQPPTEIAACVEASSGRRWRLGLRAGTAIVGLAVILAGATSSQASADRSIASHKAGTTRAGGNQHPTIPSQSSSPVANGTLSGVTAVPGRTPNNQVTIRRLATTPQHKTTLEPQPSNHNASSGYTGKHRKPGFITRRLSKGDSVDREVSLAEPAHLTPGQHTKLVRAVVRGNHIPNTRTMPVGAIVSISKQLLSRSTKFKK